MKTIKVLGPGCANCQRLEANEKVMSYGRIPNPGDIAEWLSDD